MEEKQSLLLKGNPQVGRNFSLNYSEQESSSEGSNEWWEQHSSCSSCNGQSLSSCEWESEVKENGELFFIESAIISSSEINTISGDNVKVEENEEKLNKDENVKGGRLVSWMRRRDKKLKAPGTLENSNKSSQIPEESISKSNSKDKNNEFILTVLNISSVGQGESLCEKVLGISLDPENEKEAVIKNLIPNGAAENCDDISIGDVLHGINNYNVIPHNIENILKSFNFPTEVVLKIKKNKQPLKNKTFKYQSSLVKGLLEKNEALDSVLLSQPVGIVVVDIESQNLNKGDVIYSYPDKCLLSSCRGAFVTLFHLLAEIIPKNECQSSSVIMKKQSTHIIYKSENNFLVLIAIPQIKYSLKESTGIVNDLMRNLLFNHQTIKRCFESGEKLDLDRFFSLFFFRLITNGFSSDSSLLLTAENVSSLPLESVSTPLLEDILPYAIWMALPREAQLQIDDALNELEANDFENEDECNIENQRLYHIIGSCFFHKGYLLTSHLPKEDLLDVYGFFRQNCLIQLFRKEPVKSLVIWREVYPQSVNRGLPSRKHIDYPVPIGRWFLLIVGQGYDTIAVILEAGEYCAKIEGNPGPAFSYVEEVEDTLRHMQKLGISSLATQWIENNNRFKTVTPEEVFSRRATRKKENLLGFVKSLDGSLKPSGTNTSPASSKSGDLYPSQRNRSFQQDTSEDSMSQTTSNISELSDENIPILGRRAERGKHLGDQGSEDSDSSDFDWDSSRESNVREISCSGGFEQFYLGNVGEVIPAVLSTGSENLVFHYLHIDGNEGVLVTPPSNSKRSTPKLQEILRNFRSCAQIIHSILENSIKFKKSCQNVSKFFINKSLVAVKEHGVLFECRSAECDSSKKIVNLTYWIVGRLFFTPQPREIYVCYHEDAPQNLVEIAFRLGLGAAG